MSQGILGWHQNPKTGALKTVFFSLSPNSERGFLRILAFILILQKRMHDPLQEVKMFFFRFRLQGVKKILKL